MSIQSEIADLERLAEIDGALAAIEQEIQTEREALAQKKEQIVLLESRIAKARASVEDMERVRGELIQDARQMSMQMERSREKLGRSRTEREVNAAQREIEELRKLYRDREVEIQKITTIVDQARQDMDTHGSERDAIAGALGSSEGAVVGKLTELEKQVAEKRKVRGDFAKSVSPAVYRRYEMIRKRLGSAITYTEDGTCAVCHITLPPMTFQKLRRGNEFDQCPSCHRIIYFRVAGAPEGSETASSA